MGETKCTHQSGTDKVANPSRTKKREKPVWQRRYWEHLIRDEHDWRKHMDYIHYNPVKHGIVNAPIQWPYSSFKQCVKKGWYSSEWGSSEPGTIAGMDIE
jgi:putative transposase